SDDIEHLQDFYLRSVFPSVLSLFIYGVFIGVLGLFDWVFASLMALVLAVIVFLIPFISLTMTRRKFIAMKKSRNKLYEQLTDAVFGLSDWIASGRVSSFLTNYKRDEHDLLETEKKLKRWQHIRSGMIQFFIGVAVIMMISWTGNQMNAQQLEPTLIAAFTLMMLAITDALSPTSEAIERVPAYEDSLRRLTEIEHAEIPADIQIEKEQTLKKQDSGAAIELQNVSYQYPGSSEYVIHNL
ncbi:hypothetical protein J4G37_40285, partial [Microvirga sp. 3-52]|nr:hypothetical protein [Microvirga sp. 3-52]